MKLTLGRFASLFAFYRQQRRRLARRGGACRRQQWGEELEPRIVLAAVNPLNVLVSDGAAVHEFTQGGTLVQSFQIPGGEALDENDLIVDDNGVVHIYGNVDSQDGSPLLNLDPVSGTWSSMIHSGWTRYVGDIAISGDFVFVTAAATEPGQSAALVRFDTAEGTSVAFAPNADGFRSVTVGHDGVLYASSFADSGRIIQVFDPQTLDPIRQVELPQFIAGVPASYHQFAVNSSGQIYAVGGNGLMRFDATGTLEEVVQVVSLSGLNDIDLASNGHILLTTFDGDVIQLDETLAPERITSFDAQARGVQVAFAATDIPGTGEIRGVSFVDFDRDGDQDTSEPGIAGAVVYLDLNNDGVLGPDEPSIVTAADGSYTFENVPAGDYVVREMLPEGFLSTTRGNDAGFFYGVMFRSGTTGDTDLVRIDGATGEVTRIGLLSVRLQGLVQTNSGELYGVSGFTNSLYRIDPATAAVTLVGSSGLLPVYALTYDPVEDEIYGLTKPTNMDVQTYLARFDRVTGAAVTVGGPLFGMGNRSSMSGMTYDPVSDRFIAFDNSDDEFYAIRRDGSAVLIADPSSFDTRGLATNSRQFVFQNVGPFGNTQLNAIDFTTGLVENIAVLSDGQVLDAIEWVGDRSLYRVSIAPGRTADSISFGRWDPAATGTITGISFEDFDGDGVRDFNEPGIEGAVVYLDLNDNGALDADEPSVTTAANGVYTFEDVAPGGYVVREILPLGFHSTTRGNDPGTYYGVMFVSGTTGASDLVRIDGTTGVVERVGSLPQRIHGLVQTNSGELYGISGFTNSLYRIDPDTAAITLVGNTGVLPVFALGYDPVEDQIYGLSKPADIHPETYLIRIDRTSGAATQVGGPIAGLDRRGPVGGMTYDPASDRFIVYDNFDAQFYAVSRDGSAKLLVDLPSNFSRVLATNARDVVFQSLNVNGNRDLNRINLGTGEITHVLSLSEREVMESLEWVGDRSLYRVTVAPYQAAKNVNFGNERYNSPPTVTPAGPYVISEGDGVTLSATSLDPDGDELFFAWDLDGDGDFDDGFGSDVEVSAADLLAAGIADDGEYTIAVQVQDGIFTVAAETTITVTNQVPQITVLDSEATTVGQASEGSTVVVGGSFIDPGVFDTHTATIDWGDGTTAEMTISQGADSGTLQASHEYVDGGSYEVLVTLIDDDGGVHQQALTLFVTGARLQDGVLQIVGTGADDEVSVNRQADGTLMLHADFLSDAGGLRLFGPDHPVDTIVVWLGDGDDTFTLAGNVEISLIALGQAGQDQIQGGRGRDLLIGGAGVDDLMGHMDEDILVGGSTAFDADLASLLAIFDEWSSTERSFSERMQNLTDGTGSPERLNGDVYLLAGSTVIDDADGDALDGGPDSDWVFVGVGDEEP